MYFGCNPIEITLIEFYSIAMTGVAGGARHADSFGAFNDTRIAHITSTLIVFVYIVSFHML